MKTIKLIEEKISEFRKQYEELPELIILGIMAYYNFYKYIKALELGLPNEDMLVIEKTAFIKEHSNNIGTIPMINGIPYKISSSIGEDDIILLGDSKLELSRLKTLKLQH